MNSAVTITVLFILYLKKHIETMVDCYYSMLSNKPKLSFSSTLEKGDHPKIAMSECLDSDGIPKH